MMHEAEAIFRNAVPRTLQRAILRAVFDGLAVAHASASVMDREFFADALPVLRRLAVEPMLSKLVLPRGFQSEVIATPSTNYTQIWSKDVVITAVTRTRHVKRVEPYRYRKTLAKSAQLTLAYVPMKQSEQEDYREKVYALLVYGGAHKGEFPSIARFVFPLDNGVLLPFRVDLLAEHSDIVDSYKTKVPAAAATAKLRKRKKDGREG